MNTYLAKKITLALVLASPIYGFTVSDVAFAENTGGIKDDTAYIGENNPTGSNIVIDSLFSWKGGRNGEIYGGKNDANDEIEDSLDVSNNTITINLNNDENSVSKEHYYGGYYSVYRGDNVNADNNKIILNSGYMTGWFDIGKIGGDGNARNNEMVINGGTVDGSFITVGSVKDGTVSDNTLLIKGGTFKDDIELKGGNVINSGTLENNKILVQGTADNIIDFTEVSSGTIAGAQQQYEVSAYSNIVDVNYADFGSVNIYGAGGDSGRWDYGQKANDNKVNINNSTINGTSAIKGIRMQMAKSEGITEINSNIVEINNSQFNVDEYNKGNVEIAGVDLVDISTTKNTESKTQLTNNTVEINNSTINGNYNVELIGAGASGYNNTIDNNKLIINNSKIRTDWLLNDNGIKIYGGYVYKGRANAGEIAGGSIINNLVEINDTTIGDEDDTNIDIYASYFDNEQPKDLTPWNGETKNNMLVIKGMSAIEKANLYGYGVTNADTINVEADNNKLVLDNWAGKVNSVNNFTDIEFKNIKDEVDVILNPTQILDLTDMTVSMSTEGLDLSENSSRTLIQNMTNADLATMNIKDGEVVEETDNGVRVHELSHEISDTKDKLLLNVGKSVLAGNYMDDSGKSYGNNVLNINEGFHTNAGVVAGSYATDSNAAQGGKVVVSGDFTGKTDSIYAGYSENGAVNNNDIELQQTANVENLALYGANKAGSNNTLTVNSWQGNVKNIGNFNTVNFTNLAWQPNNAQAVINITGTEKIDLSNTKVNVEKIALAGGQTINAGQSMNLISGNQIDNFTQGTVKTTAGVTTDVEAQVAGDGKNVAMTVTSVGVNEQTDLVAENRAVAAAFLNQGGDLISDGLDSLTDQYGYGMKTFAAVYGNRSTYDVNSDLKINGWSEIIGIGEKKRFNDSDFAYGVFYENGSGNYRTYNEFNNEFFCGDGDLVYNGGGIAARLSKDNGMYFEGSLRAGTLKSEMSNALKDGSGNSYGYENDSTYYGAHVGVGRVLKLDENRDLDIYGKFFHTYIDGDNFTVAGDRFSFDSVTSDRLRIGAQLTTNKNNKWSTHYGLAYEYEFNGDSDMKAGQFDLPTQSLEGGTIIGEIGLTYQGSEFSPWSLDLNLRGYEGQREGFSGHVQATYTF
ncbi:autotransporter outer membrane beta-barrel domain-containing protein [Megamonas hypermegale]|uniref:autotransporter outer membrane beta-barrel domain-containing protein n=1 Tax=Megamonas hypermegale TaxID=158847 RepID=UPI0026EFA521|nr:autotransporter outer membrane beta-barrel domain-containing protein [Megamonas hypermegale]